MLGVGRDPKVFLGDRRQPLLTHQACDSVAANGEASFDQLDVDTWAAVGLSALGVDGSDLDFELCVAFPAPGRVGLGPAVVAAAGDL